MRCGMDRSPSVSNCEDTSSVTQPTGQINGVKAWKRSRENGCVVADYSEKNAQNPTQQWSTHFLDAGAGGFEGGGGRMRARWVAVREEALRRGCYAVSPVFLNLIPVCSRSFLLFSVAQPAGVYVADAFLWSQRKTPKF